MQTEMKWRGERILQVDYTPKNDIDCYGFKINQAFVVRDDFDDECLPTLQQWFWSPTDAIAAIEMRDLIAPEMKAGKRWPTTVAYEYNQMTLYRRNFDQVYLALNRIKKTIAECDQWGESANAKVKDILTLLHQNMHERRVA